VRISRTQEPLRHLRNCWLKFFSPAASIWTQIQTNRFSMLGVNSQQSAIPMEFALFMVRFSQQP
jgi:hypothetical protein